MADVLEGPEAGGGASPGVDPAGVALALAGASRERADSFLVEQEALIKDQRHHLHEQLKQIHLDVWEKRLGVLLRVATAFIGLAVAAALAWMIWNAANSRDLIMDSFSVPPDNYDVGMLSDFLVEFMKAVGLAKASLVGSSLGSAVTAYTAVHHPEYVDKIVLTDGAGFCSPAVNPNILKIRNAVTRDDAREFFRFMFYNKDLVTEQMVEDNWVRILRTSYTINRILETLGKVGCVTDEQMAGVKAPTLIVWGASDPLASPSTADRLERDIKGSRKVILDKAGHLSQIEQPGEFNRVVGQFLKEP
jgi:pimeloyl-ACP methyl ester carboxylesterase